MTYFTAGLWHFAAAMAFSATLGLLSGGELDFWLRRPEFLIPLIIASCALFFVPDKWAKKGPLKFLHYPLPDWDVLFLGPASHRHWLTHSPLLPVLLFFAARYEPFLQQQPFASVAAGLAVGVGSHLFWDCVGSRGHKIIFVPHWLALREASSRIYLLAGAVVSLGVATYFSWPPQADLVTNWRFARLLLCGHFLQ
jgi:hypothetical protein